MPTFNGIPEEEKIDRYATEGLLGVSDSLAYRVHELERHFHSSGSWFGTAATPSGEVHVADRIGNASGAFQLDAGNNTWGAWVQIFGSSDTPARAAQTHFDPHEMVISAAGRTTIYFIQFARGDSGDLGYAAGNYTEFVIDTTSKAGGVIIAMHTGRAPTGSKLWARCMCPGNDTGTIDFYIGIHEYQG